MRQNEKGDSGAHADRNAARALPCNPIHVYDIVVAMDLFSVIKHLRDERKSINEAISSLERMAAVKLRNRRRPQWLTEIEKQVAKPKHPRRPSKRNQEP